MPDQHTEGPPSTPPASKEGDGQQDATSWQVVINWLVSTFVFVVFVYLSRKLAIPASDIIVNCWLSAS
jgi:hypothetical protein